MLHLNLNSMTNLKKDYNIFLETYDFELIKYSFLFDLT